MAHITRFGHIRVNGITSSLFAGRSWIVDKTITNQAVGIHKKIKTDESFRGLITLLDQVSNPYSGLT